MGNFFKTLIIPNAANALKWFGGVAYTVIGLIGTGAIVIPGLPVWVVTVIPYILGTAAVGAVHAAHRADPPFVKVADR